jgi:hypothetical protein
MSPLIAIEVIILSNLTCTLTGLGGHWREEERTEAEAGESSTTTPTAQHQSGCPCEKYNYYVCE